MNRLAMVLFLGGLAFFADIVEAEEDLLLGFELGGSVSEAEKYAESQGWKLRPLSVEVPGQWVVQGADAGLFTCNEKVASVQRQIQGSVDEFATLVTDIMIHRGVPETKVITFRSGKSRISHIDSRFVAKDGSGVSVQLSSTDGKASVSTNVWLGGECLE